MKINTLNYVVEKLSSAVSALAVLPGDVRTRLEKAAMVMAPLTEGDFPESLQTEYSELHAALTRLPATGNEGSIASTLRRMNNDTGTEIAQRIVDLYYRAQASLEESRKSS